MKKKNIVLLIVLLAIGFATVSTTLVINGLLAIGESDDFNIIFTNAVLDGSSRKKFISDDKQNITFTSNVLKSLKDTSTLEYEVTNTSRNYDANVAIVCNIVNDEGQIEETNDYFKMTYEPTSMELLAGETKTGLITAELTKVVEDDASYKIKCELNATPTTRDDLGSEYIEPFANAGTMISKDSDSFWSHKEDITNIVFENEAKEHTTTEELTYDVTAEESSSPVMAYLVPNEDDATKYTLYINSDGGVKANSSASNYFSYFSNLEKIDGLEYFDTSLVTSMYNMFSGCTNLTKLDLSNFNTKNVLSMDSMFYRCNKLIELDVGNFNTESVKNMSNMFYDCASLIKLDLNNFDTKNVINMYNMFNGCSSLTTLDLSNFDTSIVTDIGQMFRGCASLTTLDLSHFNTSKVTQASYLVAECSNLKEVNISGFDLSKANYLYYMFYKCYNLEKINLSNVNTTNAVNMIYMFAECTSLKELDLSSFDTSSVDEFKYMFYKCSSLKKLDLSNFNMSKATRLASMFQECSSLEELDITSFNTEYQSYQITGLFNKANDKLKITVINDTIKNWILSLDSYNRPEAWKDDNIIVKEV